MFGLADIADFFGYLHGQFPGGAHDECFHLLAAFAQSLDDGNTKSGRLAGTGLRLADHILAFQCQRDSLGLNRRRLFKAHIRQSGNDLLI